MSDETSCCDVETEILELAKKQADEMLAAHRNHPSIVCWGVGNELGGQFEACQQCSCTIK